MVKKRRRETERRRSPGVRKAKGTMGERKTVPRNRLPRTMSRRQEKKVPRKKKRRSKVRRMRTRMAAPRFLPTSFYFGLGSWLSRARERSVVNLKER